MIEITVESTGLLIKLSNFIWSCLSFNYHLSSLISPPLECATVSPSLINSSLFTLHFSLFT